MLFKSKLFKKSLFILGFLSLFGAAVASINPNLRLLNKLTHNQLSIINTIPLKSNLTAYVVKPNIKNTPARKMVVYILDGNYLIMGNVVNSKSENMTSHIAQKYIFAGMAQKILSQAKSTHWIQQGSNKAPHKVYIVIDPNCIFCHELYTLIQPKIQAGEYQVRWILAGFLKPSSAGKAAAIIMGGKDALKKLHQDETHFNVAQEEGGIKPLDIHSKNPAVQKAFKMIKSNTEFFESYPFTGTPTFIYKNQSGQPKYFSGLLRTPKGMHNLLSSFGVQTF